ncbi:glycine cleavage system protein H [Latilactobacillus curvatus]|uniref:glycine cleavage system protein H n=1 Tax=Latilactobacillus curvatus TaxID=28038 RepID=UPI00223A70E7|nr:glycine cleavage system protein H [Latilactobacillus curvatus]MCS8616628.1 glycine cleavage system protein H [Latilactobacillus curvatus]
MTMNNNDYFWTEEIAASIRRIGITKAAQDEFGLIKFVDVPIVGQKLTANETLVAIEAEKMVQDLDSPLAGELVNVNTPLADNPELLNADNEKDAWIADIRVD